MKAVIEQCKRARHLRLKSEQLQGKHRPKLVRADISWGNGHGDRKVRDQQDHQPRSECRSGSNRVQDELDGREVEDPRCEDTSQRESHWPPEIEDAQPREEGQLAPRRVPTHECDREDREDGHAGEHEQPRANGRRQLRNEPRQGRRQHDQRAHVSQLLQAGNSHGYRERHVMATTQDPDAECVARARRSQDGSHGSSNRVTEQRAKRYRAEWGQSEAPECGFPGQTRKCNRGYRQQRDRVRVSQGAAQLRDVELTRPNDNRQAEADCAYHLQSEPPPWRDDSSRGVCDFVTNELSHGRKKPFRQWAPQGIGRSIATDD